jgi:branched-chain amino acid transport system permease protein
MPVYILLKIWLGCKVSYSHRMPGYVSSVKGMLHPFQILLINAAVFFGHYVIIAAALNFQFGNGGIPNMGSNVSVAIGSYTVSSVVLRVTMWVASQAGLVFGSNWVYDNPTNVSLMNKYFIDKPLLSISIFIFSLAVAMIFGSLAGWVLGKLSGRLRATRLMIFLIIISDATSLIAANNEEIAGGTLGAFIPNFFAWYSGEQMVILALVILIVGLVAYIIINTMVNSPFGRLMRSVRDNEMTLQSTGKNVTQIRSQVMMFGSAIMAMSGVLLAYYYSFVQYNMYSKVDYTFWPWLMITIGGLGSNGGSYLGALACVSIIKGLNLSKQTIGPMLIGTEWIKLLNYFEDMLLGILLLLFLIFKPGGLVPEKNLVIKSVDYIGIVTEEESKSE